jgi:hypothetical protein
VIVTMGNGTAMRIARRRTMSAGSYGDRLREQERQYQWQRFLANYTPEAWAQMSPLEQSQAWATWQQNERLIAASNRRPNLTWLWIVVGIIGFLVLFGIVSRVLFY